MKITLIQNTINYGLNAIKTEDSRRMVAGARLTLNLNYFEGHFVPNLNNVEEDLILTSTGEPWKINDELNPFWLNYEITFSSDRQQVLNLDDYRDLIKYKVGVKFGLIAETLEDAKDIMNKSIFYAYSRENENKLQAEKNELYTDVLFELTGLKKNNNKKIIFIATEILDDLSIKDTSEALNRLKTWLDEKDTYNRGLTLNGILKEDSTILEHKFIIKKSINYGLIKKNSKGFYCNVETTTEYGKNLNETITMLCSSKFEEELGSKDIKNSKKYSIYSMVNSFENKNESLKLK